MLDAELRAASTDYATLHDAVYRTEAAGQCTAPTSGPTGGLSTDDRQRADGRG